ncbi:MAG: type IV toxin-antitoxin system AbiEi family antitoxin domain-containing protein [Pontiellaceae bacterium]|nr:type IV toxin-antitoxin system AbiEi family antitoxin domain-containing protein [Pontiellaceae bacterium]
MKTADHRVINIVKKNGGIARTSDFLSNGVHPRDLYRMRDSGKLECLSRGLYQLPDQIPDEPDLATVCKKAPGGVVCLISALSLHEITTEIPRCIHIALKRGSEAPRISYPPTQYYWMSGAAYTEGIEIKNIGGIEVPVYCVEKTLVDCFKYRNKIGMDVVLEGLKFYRERHRFDVKRLLHYAKICRMDKIMRPYLEASI